MLLKRSENAVAELIQWMFWELLPRIATASFSQKRYSGKPVRRGSKKTNDLLVNIQADKRVQLDTAQMACV